MAPSGWRKQFCPRSTRRSAPCTSGRCIAGVETEPVPGGLSRRRCLVPANGWFEWQRAGRAKQPWFVALADGSSVSFAALWERWDQADNGLETFTIITTQACNSLADIHHRQPAIIHPAHVAAWLDPASRSEQLLDLVRAPCAGPFEKHPVSTRVNSVANNDAAILAPARHDAAEPGLFDR